MAIHRVGQPTDRPTPSTDLGRILVTIDDSEALFKLLGDPARTDHQDLAACFDEFGELGM